MKRSPAAGDKAQQRPPACSVRSRFREGTDIERRGKSSLMGLAMLAVAAVFVLCALSNPAWSGSFLPAVRLSKNLPFSAGGREGGNRRRAALGASGRSGCSAALAGNVAAIRFPPPGAGVCRRCPLHGVHSPKRPRGPFADRVPLPGKAPAFPPLIGASLFVKDGR